MAMDGGRIDIIVGYKVDEAGIAQLRRELQEISSLSATAVRQMNPSLSMNQAIGVLNEVRNAATQVQTAMNSAFNTQTGVLNLRELQNSLRTLNLSEVQRRFYNLGETGISTFF